VVASCILTAASEIKCTHLGKCCPTVTSPRVKILGSPALLLNAQLLVLQCPLAPALQGPDLNGQWIPGTGTIRVLSSGQSLATQQSISTCQPSLQPMLIFTTQTKVRAS
jgi:hypothetical protein